MLYYTGFLNRLPAKASEKPCCEKDRYALCPLCVYIEYVRPEKPLKQKTVSFIQETWQTPYLSVATTSPYVIFRKRFRSLEIDHTDGIGTKGMYHWQRNTLKAAVTDALAMNLNDLAMVRAIPYKLQNHLTVPVEDERILAIIKAIVAACKTWDIAMTGGETSIHDTMNGLDISMTVSGFITHSKTNACQIGDAIIGLPSNGLHSNGFSIIRKLFGEEYRPEFTRPTTIYLKTILRLCEQFPIHGMMHITGGAFTKVKDILPNNAAVKIDATQFPRLPIFQEIYGKAVPDEQMYTTFNCGIDYLCTAPKAKAAEIAHTSGGKMIGTVVNGNGEVIITSAFSGRIIQI